MSAQSTNGISLDGLEPFAAQLRVTAGPGGIAEPTRMVASMLTDIAERCDSAGSSLIGHIKCRAQVATDTGVEVFHCDLTSLRLGARCSGAPSPLAPDGVLDIDLVVLVYALTHEALEQIVRECCSLQQSRSGLAIEVRPPGVRPPATSA
jgi:hypothetical protein